MPKGVYERTERHREISRENQKKATAASAAYWRGRKQSPEHVAAHAEAMRGRPAHNKGVPMSAEQRQKMITHGHSAGGRTSPTYRSWRSMLQRCYDPSKGNYVYYGARGITVCDQWRDFPGFLADMGLRPEGMQLSRIDNDGNYGPGNVVWASQADNVAERNRRLAKRA